MGRWVSRLRDLLCASRLVSQSGSWSVGGSVRGKVGGLVGR